MDGTGDCRVNLEDFALFVSQWLTEGTITVPDVVGMTQVDHYRSRGAVHVAIALLVPHIHAFTTSYSGNLDAALGHPEML